MKSDKIRKFMTLGGQALATEFETGDEKKRLLGAQLLLSETLEYVIKGLGVIPEFDGVKITDANALQYSSSGKEPDPVEMLDGLADVAYTMYWNSEAFAIPLEEGFDMVCDNNLEKFVALNGHLNVVGSLDKAQWNCKQGVTWPEEVVDVEVVDVDGEFYAVGKDENGKVRKPSSYKSVDLEPLLKKANG